MKKVKKVVLIDDDAIDCYVHQHLLKHFQIAEQVEIIHSAKSALQYITDNYVDKQDQHKGKDLILLDLYLPLMNGFECLEAIRTLKGVDKSKFAIAMITSSINPRDKIKADLYRDVLCGYLIKPLQPNVIKELVNSL